MSGVAGVRAALLAPALFAGCLSLEGKDRCVTDADCLRGRVCGPEQRCIDESQRPPPDAGCIECMMTKAYGEPCAGDDECTSRLCNRMPLLCEPTCFCSRECSIAGDLSNCGREGRYCANNVYVGIEAVCVYLADSGSDLGADDNKLIIGALATGRLEGTEDVDVFAGDLQGNRDYQIAVTPIPGATMDLAVEVYTHLGLNYRRNTTGAGEEEAVGIPGILKDGRLFFLVRTMNGDAGPYTILLDYL